MKKTSILRKLLNEPPVIRIMGAHDGLTAKLAERAGFPVVWSSSMGISATYAVPDANLLTMTQFLHCSDVMNCATSIPVIADCSSGYGGINNIIHLVREHERLDIAGVCIEDKTFPKTNSFSKGDQSLVTIQDFCAKLHAAQAYKSDPDFNIIARVESFIAGSGVDDALERASAYEEAGADAIVIHSRANTAKEIQQFMGHWRGRKPIIVIPTTYPSVTTAELADLGVWGVIYANQGLRASIRSIEQIFSELYEADSLACVQDRIATLDEVFELQNVSAWKDL